MAVGRLDTDGFAEGVGISGNLACVADGMSGLVIADISNPAAPVRKGLSQARDGRVQFQFRVLGHTSLREPRGLQVYDISNPVLPVRLGGLDTPRVCLFCSDCWLHRLCRRQTSGIQLWIAPCHPAPTTLGVLATPGVAMDVSVAGNLAAVAAENLDWSS